MALQYGMLAYRCSLTHSITMPGLEMLSPRQTFGLMVKTRVKNLGPTSQCLPLASGTSFLLVQTLGRIGDGSGH